MHHNRSPLRTKRASFTVQNVCHALHIALTSSDSAAGGASAPEGSGLAAEEAFTNKPDTVSTLHGPPSAGWAPDQPPDQSITKSRGI